MSQNDFQIANDSGASVRADLNSALQALATLSSGNSAPGTTYAGQLWWDTGNDKIKIRNAANDGWVDFAHYDGVTYEPIAAGSDVLKADPEHATDSATDAFVSATNTTPPADGVVIIRDFQSPNTTTTPTLDGKTLTTKDGSALWGGAVSGVHALQRDETADTYLALEPIGTAANVNDAPVKRDSNGRAKFADPSAAQDAATKEYTDTGDLSPETAVDLTNGGANDLSQVDYTSLKQGANRIEVVFRNLSVDSADNVFVQIGDAGGVETSGYSSVSSFVSDAGQSASSTTSGYLIQRDAAGNTHSLTVVLTRVDNNIWVASSGGARVDATVTLQGGGLKSLSGELDRVRIVTGGTANFNGGTVNILVE